MKKKKSYSSQKENIRTKYTLKHAALLYEEPEKSEFKLKQVIDNLRDMGVEFKIERTNCGMRISVRAKFETEDRGLDEYFANLASSIGLVLRHGKYNGKTYYLIEEKPNFMHPASALIHAEHVEMFIEDLVQAGKIKLTLVQEEKPEQSGVYRIKNKEQVA